MSILARIFGSSASVSGVSGAVTDVAGIFATNKEKDAQRAADAQSAALSQFSNEFNQKPVGFFDRFINGINRLPRPLLALGTIGLFVFAFIDPEGFTVIMQALNFVPEALWWLLGSVVSFFFGARTLEVSQRNKPVPVYVAPTVQEPVNTKEQEEISEVLENILEENAALKDAGIIE